MTAFADMVIASGAPADQAIDVVAETADRAGMCPMFGAFRVVGADPRVLVTEFKDAARRFGIPCTAVRFGNRMQEVLDCPEGGGPFSRAFDGYYAFVDDAVFFVEAANDDRAAALLASIPDAPAVAPDPSPIVVSPATVYRGAFYRPFTVSLDRHWSVTTDGPDAVELVDSDYRDRP